MKILAIMAASLFFSAAGAQEMASPRPQPDAAPAGDAQVEAARALIGRPLFLRCLCEDSRQIYDLHGKPQEPAKKPTDWTLAGFDLQTVSRKDSEHLELSGPRVAIRYNINSKLFDRQPLKLTTVKIDLAVGSDVKATARALGEIFADGIDYPLQQSTTEAWRHYFNPGLKWPSDGLNDASIITPTGKETDIVYPKPEKKTEANLTMESEQNHVTGSVILRFVVDTTGTPRRIAIYQPLGYGLDVRTVEAISKWHFAPGTKGGQPVPMTITFEQKFLPAQRPAQ